MDSIVKLDPNGLVNDNVAALQGAAYQGLLGSGCPTILHHPLGEDGKWSLRFINILMFPIKPIWEGVIQVPPVISAYEMGDRCYYDPQENPYLVLEVKVNPADLGMNEKLTLLERALLSGYGVNSLAIHESLMDALMERVKGKVISKSENIQHTAMFKVSLGSGVGFYERRISVGRTRYLSDGLVYPPSTDFGASTERSSLVFDYPIRGMTDEEKELMLLTQPGIEWGPPSLFEE